MASDLRILLLDDHALFREGLARLLDAEPGIRVVAQAASIDDALRTIALDKIDLILLDYDLGNEIGTEVLESIHVLKNAPRVLIVTAGMTDQAIKQAILRGACGVVLKHSGPENLIDAIGKAMRNVMLPQRNALLPRVVAIDEASGVKAFRDRPLTQRQSKVLHELLDGLSNKEIAKQMSMSESSVKAVIQELFEKAGVRTRSQLVRIAIEKHSRDWLGS